jgi:[acyl-carrier-protein] S-malonyltransferase/polyketide biosynthesis malonyl-CoA-[acyl-carrier-protein] transacylase
MGRGLFEHFRDLCRQADEVLGYSVETLCSDDPERLLNKTEYAQPAIYVVNVLHYLTVRRQGLPPADYVAGHSLGEYNALFAAGAFDFETGLTLVKRRAELMGEADGGGMAVVAGASEDAIEETLTTRGLAGVVIANYNAPRQFVLSGSKEELERIKPIFEDMEGVRGFAPLRVSGAFHSPRMKTAARAFREFLDSVGFGEFQTPVISNVTGRPFEPGQQAVREALAEQITEPVRWAESVRYMRNAGVSDFVELGERKVLTTLIDEIKAEEQRASGDRQELIARIKREVLQPEIGDAALQFDENQSFRQLGLDSIVYVRLARKVQAVFGIPFKPDMMYANRTCAALADYLLAQQGDEKAEPKDSAPWRQYRDERVLALLRDCANGTLSVEKAIETVRAGRARHR